MSTIEKKIESVQEYNLLKLLKANSSSNPLTSYWIQLNHELCRAFATNAYAIIVAELEPNQWHDIFDGLPELVFITKLKRDEEMAQRNQQRQNEYFGMTAKYNSAENQKQRLKDAGLNPALMYGSAGSGGAGTGSTGGASGSGVGLSQAQAVGMGLQLSQIKAQTNLMNAESAKAYAEANKIKGVDTDATKQGIKESEAKIDEIIAKIPSEKQQYHVGKAIVTGKQIGRAHV